MKVKVGKTKMIITEFTEEEKRIFLLFSKRLKAELLCFASFIGVWCIRNKVISEVNRKRMASLNVRHVKINKQKWQRSVQEHNEITNVLNLSKNFEKIEATAGRGGVNSVIAMIRSRWKSAEISYY